MDSPLGTVIIYARDMQKAAAFYARHFGFLTNGEVIEGLIELGQRVCVRECERPRQELHQHLEPSASRYRGLRATDGQ